MKNPIHMTPAEKLALHSEAGVRATHEMGKKIDETTRAVREVAAHMKDKSVETTGFTGLLKAGKRTVDALEVLKSQHPAVVQKLEEIKSASLITNKTLKELRDKDLPKADFAETNRLLALLIEEQQKPVVVTLKIT